MMKNVLLFLFLSNVTFGQENTTITFFKDKYAQNEVPNGPYMLETKVLNDSITSKVFSNVKKGRKLWSKSFLRDQPYGTWNRYDKKGNIESTMDYNFILTYGKYVPEGAIDKSGRPIDTFTPSNLEKIQTHLRKNFRYPEIAQENGTQGRVEIQFTINKLGQVGNISILDGQDLHLDTECFRLINSLPELEPLLENGEKVSSYHTYAISFKLL